MSARLRACLPMCTCTCTHVRWLYTCACVHACTCTRVVTGREPGGRGPPPVAWDGVAMPCALLYWAGTGAPRDRECNAPSGGEHWTGLCGGGSAWMSLCLGLCGGSVAKTRPFGHGCRVFGRVEPRACHKAWFQLLCFTACEPTMGAFPETPRMCQGSP